MKTPQKNTEKRTPKELILATLTDAGLLRPLYYFLVASAAVGGTVGISAATLTPDQEEQRQKVRVVLTPPKKLEYFEGAVVSSTTSPTTHIPSTTTPESSSPSPVETEKTNLPTFMSRLETATRDGEGLYDLLKDAKVQLTQTELRNLILRLVEITDENYPLPTQGMSEEQMDEYFENKLGNELSRRRAVAERFGENLASDLVMNDPILKGYLFSAMEDLERAARFEQRRNSGLPEEEIPLYTHRLRGNMTAYLCRRIIQYGSRTKAISRAPQQILDELWKNYEYLKELKTLRSDALQEYREMIENVS